MDEKRTLQSYDADDLLRKLQPAKRAEVAHKLMDKLETAESELERKLTWAVARQLAEDAVEMVRTALARSVGKCKYLPKDIGFTLAYDLDSVSVPFLKVTEIFSEDELCEIAGAVSDNVRVAIAGREDLTPKVSGRLAKTGGIDVAHILVENQRATIDEDGFSVLTERFGSDETLLERMSMRSDLTPNVATDLIKKVSRSAREQLEKRYSMAPDFVNVLAQEAESDVLLDLAKFRTAQEAMGYADDLNNKGELSHTFCLMAIRAGNLPFFEAAMAVRTGTSVENVELILREGSIEAISLLCKKARLPNLLHREIAEAVNRETHATSHTSSL